MTGLSYRPLYDRLVGGFRQDGQQVGDLHEAIIDVANDQPITIGDMVHNASGPCFAEAIFRNLEDALVEEIGKWPQIYGCVAWLTNRRILEALAKQPEVSIIVQKEDWLRPDRKSSYREMLELYGKLKGGCRYSLPVLYCTGGDPILPAVRCVGNHNSDKSPAFPRMHNKFIVFCDDEKPGQRAAEGDEFGEAAAVPKVVWTGSFNFTHNATASLENAVILHSETIAAAYLAEFAAILGLSEPLDWTSKWVQPEYRMGT